MLHTIPVMSSVEDLIFSQKTLEKKHSVTKMTWKNSKEIPVQWITGEFFEMSLSK